MVQRKRFPAPAGLGRSLEWVEQNTPSAAGA